MMSQQVAPYSRNTLLCALTHEDLALLRPYLTRVKLEREIVKPKARID
jgi:hypothetical protein